MVNLYSISMLLFSFGVVVIAILALVKRKDKIAKHFLIFSFSVSGWGFLWSFWMNQLYSKDTILWLARWGHLFAVFIPIAWLRFVFEYINKREPFRYFYLINYLVTAFLAVASLTPSFIPKLHLMLNLNYFPSAGPTYHFFTLLFFTIVPFAFFYLLLAYRRAEGQAKQQLKCFLIATLIGFSAGGSTFLWAYKVPCPLFLIVLMPAYPIFMGIALIRYGLFDVQQIADAFHKEKLAAIGMLAASINHEIRNPLYVIQGLAESHLANMQEGIYAQSDQALTRANEILKKASEQVARAMDIMRRFAEFSKPSGNKNTKETLVLGQVLGDVIGLASNEFELQKIKLNLVPMNGLKVFANRRHLEEIFFNLIVNACQAMRENGGELSINAYKTHRKTCVEVSDTGPGVLKEDLSKIFEPFYSTKGEKGSGLGLYITKQLVERNGGKIFVRSRNGEGTTFIVEFLKEQNESL